MAVSPLLYFLSTRRFALTATAGLLGLANLAAEGGALPPVNTVTDNTPVFSEGGSVAVGQGSFGGPPPQGPNNLDMLLPFLLVVGVFVLIMWTGTRKQKREQKQHQEMVDALKTGQQVITAGGVHGTVLRKGEATVDLKTGDGDTVITFGLNAIVKVVVEGDKAKEGSK